MNAHSMTVRVPLVGEEDDGAVPPVQAGQFFNHDFDPSALRDQDEIIDARWLERTRHALHAGDRPVPPPLRPSFRAPGCYRRAGPIPRKDHHADHDIHPEHRPTAPANGDRRRGDGAGVGRCRV